MCQIPSGDICFNWRKSGIKDSKFFVSFSLSSENESKVISVVVVIVLRLPSGSSVGWIGSQFCEQWWPWSSFPSLLVFLCERWSVQILKSIVDTFRSVVERREPNVLLTKLFMKNDAVPFPNKIKFCQYFIEWGTFFF